MASSRIADMVSAVAMGATAILVAGAAQATPVAERDMLRYCQGEAAAKFGVSPQDFEMGALEKTGNGAHLAHGRYKSPGEHGVRFLCRFHPDGEFFWVRTEEEHAGRNEQSGGGHAYKGGEVLNGRGDTAGGGDVTGLINTRDDDRWLVSLTVPNATCTAVFREMKDRESTALLCTDGKNGAARLHLDDHGKPRSIDYTRGSGASGSLRF